ncbi:class I SAM-dependent methyltransferase [Kineococcus endophyticus]|uniref:Class I SAM-dependent methyltransferase n=1 Tax=Kineococcus endophyticus TaxID=1181883 RepID=A0ABV3P432_9ACTN
MESRPSVARPFYSTFADLYDHVVTDPVGPWTEAVEGALASRGVERGTLLDAGCGTGRHAAAFAALGHRVTLLDASAELLAVASTRCPGAPAHLGDVRDPHLPGSFDVLTCRGVLNDLLGDADRDAAVRSSARLLRPGGMLALDVRDVGRSRERTDDTPRSTTVHRDTGSAVTFTHRSRWEDGLLVVAEEHRERSPDGSVDVQEFTFRMRPWTEQEVHERLGRAGFADVVTGPGVGGRWDRLFVTAVRRA